ncbi:MAG TPA: hypothetical protein G4O07_09530 [Dehalococcoidia bacterium]|nr:hypothetical protein [Dehalococcoidia bacterium]
MDSKKRDLEDRLARLIREEERLTAEVRTMLPPSSVPAGDNKPIDIILTGEKLAKHRWIESRLVEIKAGKRQLKEKLDRLW